MPTIHIRQMPPLHTGQHPIHKDPSRFRIVRAGRRFGKTKLGVRECVEVGLGGGRAWWVAPSYRLGRIGWRDLHRLAVQVPGHTIDKGLMLARLPGGGEVQVRTAKNPDELRGDSLDFVVLDEAAYMTREAWTEALRPALADRRGRALFISTPAGMVNWLADLWHENEHSDTWGMHHYSSYANPYLDPAELDGLRGELGELLYRQEILAEFVELEGTLIRSVWFDYYRPITVVTDDTEKVLYRLPGDSLVAADECSRFITVDPALSTKDTADYTVMVAWAVTPTGKYLVEDVVRERLEAPDVIRRAAALLARWGAGWIGFESTAYQASLIQFARKAGLPARPLKADRDKVQRALPLAARLEAGDVLFRAEAPWLDALERELLLFPNGEHDDQVDALAYGVLARQEHRREWAAR